MADDDIREKIVTEFFLNTCQLHRQANEYATRAWQYAATIQSAMVTEEFDVIPLTTGSVAEFYVEPMLPCVGDVDVMFQFTNRLAIPAGFTPPTQLPGEFDSRVEVSEIVDNWFPGYVYLMSSYLLRECVDDGKYNAVQCKRGLLIVRDSEFDSLMHGPAVVQKWSDKSIVLAPTTNTGFNIAESRSSVDNVHCTRCLIWPPQAARWPTRHRNYGWPDSATVDRVVSNGCDVVHVAHHLCRHDKWSREHQWRLSFSRAEIVLLNSWMPEQQIVYHLLRRFMKN